MEPDPAQPPLPRQFIPRAVEVDERVRTVGMRMVESFMMMAGGVVGLEVRVCVVLEMGCW